MKYIGIDIGGTNIVCGVVNERKEILIKQSCKTKAFSSSEEICNDIINLIFSILNKSNTKLNEIPYIGVGCPGIINKERGIVKNSSNLPFQNFNLKKFLEDKINKKILIENDANAAAYGEYIAGATQNFKNSITITLGTGVGSGIIIDKKIYNGLDYAGAEIGHMVIKQNGRKCSCGRKGCFEAYASATGLIRTTKKYMKKFDKNQTILWDLTENNIKKISGKTAFDAMYKEDKIGKLIVDKYIKYLSCGLINIINIFSPEIICIGGGICKEGENLLSPIREYIKKESYNKSSKDQTKLVKAKLGNNAGIIGAAFLQ